MNVTEQSTVEGKSALEVAVDVRNKGIPMLGKDEKGNDQTLHNLCTRGYIAVHLRRVRKGLPVLATNPVEALFFEINADHVKKVHRQDRSDLLKLREIVLFRDRSESALRASEVSGALVVYMHQFIYGCRLTNQYKVRKDIDPKRRASIVVAIVSFAVPSLLEAPQGSGDRLQTVMDGIPASYFSPPVRTYHPSRAPRLQEPRAIEQYSLTENEFRLKKILICVCKDVPSTLL